MLAIIAIITHESQKIVMSKLHQQLLDKLRSNKQSEKSDYYLFFLGTDVNFTPDPGCDLHAMSAFPKNFTEYKNSYLFIKKNKSSKLYYILPTGKHVEVKINNINEFEQKINEINPDSNPKFYLSRTQIAEVITANGGHIPNQYLRGETFSFAAQATSKLLGETGVTHENHDVEGTEHFAHAYHSDSVDLINGANTLGDQAGDRIAKGLLLSLQAIANGQTTINVSGFSRGAVEAIVLTNELARVKKALEDDLTSKTKRTLVEILKETNSVPKFCFYGTPGSYTKDALTSLLKGASTNSDEESLKEKLLVGMKKLEVHLFALDPVPGDDFKGLPVGWNEPTFYTLPPFVTKKLELVQQHETSNCFTAIIPKEMPYEVIPGCHGTGDGNQFDDNGKPIDATKTDVSGVQDLVVQRWLEFMLLTVDQQKIEELKGTVVPVHDALNNVVLTYLQADAKQRDQLLLETYQKIQQNYPAFLFLAGRCYNGLGQFLPERHVHYGQHGSIPIGDIHSHKGDGEFINTQHVQLWIAQQIKAFNFFEKPLGEQIAWLKENIEYAFKEATKSEDTEVDLSASTQLVQNQLNELMEKDKNAAMLTQALATISNTLILTYLRNHLDRQQLTACHAYFEKTISILRKAASDDSRLSDKKKQAAAKFQEVIQNGLTTNLHQHSRALISQIQQLYAESEELLKIEEDIEIKVDEQNTAKLSEIKQRQTQAWLTNTQKLISELTSLSKQFAKLAPYCNQKDLIKAVEEITKNQMFEGQEVVDAQEVNRKLSQSLDEVITKSIVLLKNQAAELLKAKSELLNNRAEGLEEKFFQEVRHLAKAKGATLAEDEQAEAELKELKEQLQKTQDEKSKLEQDKNAEIKVLKEQVDTSEKQNEELQEQLQQMEEEKIAAEECAKALQQQLDKALEDSSHQQQSATNNLQEKEETLKQWQRPEEQQALVKIANLQALTNSYLEHLKKQTSNKEVLDPKTVAITNLKNILDKADELPCKRLNSFHSVLVTSAETIKAHRDPSWQRFLRDCFRMIGLAVSGVAIYRAVKGHDVNFFRPSKGQEFVEKAQDSEPKQTPPKSSV